MQSRSRILIERDYKQLKETKLWGIEAAPVNIEDVYNWSVVLKGEMKTVWEGGVFQLYLKFTEHYNDEPPEVYFHMIPFHPNVDGVTGRVIIGTLSTEHKWNSSYDLVHILLSIQAMLKNPELDMAANREAAEMLCKNHTEYVRLVKRCVKMSQKIYSDRYLPHKEQENRADNLPVKQKGVLNDKHNSAPITLTTSNRPTVTTSSSVKVKPSVSKIAYQDYYQLWSTIGTSQTCLEDNRNTGQSLVITKEQSDEPPSAPVIPRVVPRCTSVVQALVPQMIARGTPMIQPGVPRGTPMIQPVVPRGTPVVSIRGSDKEQLNVPIDRDVDELVTWTQLLDDDDFL